MQRTGAWGPALGPLLPEKAAVPVSDFLVIFVWGVLSRGHVPAVAPGLELRPNPVPIHWSKLEPCCLLCCSERHTGCAVLGKLDVGEPFSMF